MKKKILLLLLVSTSVFSFAVNSDLWIKDFQRDAQIQQHKDNLNGMNADDFLKLTPKKFEKITGEKLSFKQKLKIKAAQKILKKKIRKHQKNEPDRGKSQIVAILLCFFLGFLGVHRFYLGYWNGILLLLLSLCGIGFIWAFVDLIRIIIGDLQPKRSNYYDKL